MAADMNPSSTRDHAPDAAAAPVSTLDHGPAAASTPGAPHLRGPVDAVTSVRLPILRWVLRQQRRGLIAWGAAMAVIAAIYVSFYPAMGDNGELDALIAGLPEGLVAALGYDAIGTAAGYLESTVFGLLGPILLLVFAVGTAARLVAGEEEAGELELESAAPVSRRQVLGERYLALLVGITWLGFVTGAVTFLLVLALEMDVASGALASTTLGLILLVVALGSVTFAAGAATGRRAVALAVGSGVAVFAYMANALAPLLEDGAWLERLSPFAWYLSAEPLVNGLGLGGAAAMVALAVLGVLVAVVTYDRRDLGV